MSNIYQDFRRVEKESNASEVLVDGIPIWEAIRTEVYRQIRINRGEWDDVSDAPSCGFRNYINIASLAVQNIFHRNPFLLSDSDILCNGYYTRQLESDGYWWDKFLDPVIMELDSYDKIYLETHDDGRHYTPARSKNIKYIDLIEVFASLVEVTGIIDYELSQKEVKQLDNIQTKIKQKLNADIELKNIVRREVTERRIKKPIFNRLVTSVNPKLALITVRHGKEILIEACKKSNIPVVELQHGILTDYEYSYHTKASGRMFPDYFFSWGPFWEQQVDMPIPNERIISTGYPYLEMKKNEYENTSAENQILFISQPNIGPELAKFALELSEIVLPTTEIVFKLHPKEQDTQVSLYNQLTNSDIQVVGRNGPGLYNLFSKSRAQVGVYSTALYEGLMFDIRTYIVDLPGTSNISDIYNEGPAELIDNPHEVICNSGTQSQNDFDTTHYFKRNSVINILSEIDNIISDT